MNKTTEPKDASVYFFKELFVYAGFIWVVASTWSLFDMYDESITLLMRALQPWNMFAVHTVKAGIEAISAQKSTFSFSHKFGDVCSLIIYFWVGPAVLLAGLRDFVIEKRFKKKIKEKRGVKNLCWWLNCNRFNLGNDFYI